MRSIDHAVQCGCENVSHFDARESLLCQEEGSDARCFERSALNRIATNSPVFGEHDPAVIANGFEPVNVRRVDWEVISECLDLSAKTAQALGNQFAAQAVVDEKGDAGKWPEAHAASGISARTISSMSAAGRS